MQKQSRGIAAALFLCNGGVGGFVAGEMTGAMVRGGAKAVEFVRDGGEAAQTTVRMEQSETVASSDGYCMERVECFVQGDS